MTLPDLVSSPGEPCALCQQPALHRCGACEGAAYCSAEHQQQHWAQHKGKCRAYTVLSNDKLGRYAVAARTLEAGEEVLTETPFVVGPKPDSYVLCLGCYAPVDGSTLCAACAWPLCSPDCEGAARHAEGECRVFREAGARFQPVEDCMDACPQLNCVAPLRLLLAREADPTRWEAEVRLMEAHDDERRGSPLWDNNQVNVVDYLRKVCKLADRFDENAIHTACGILEVNSFEIRCPNGSAVQGLYPQTAILSHNCVPNTSHCIINEEDNRLVLRTTVAVERGAELHTTYTHTLSPTLLRREHLRQCKFFDCACARCRDPTELGTHLSTLKCNKCDPGLIMSSNPLDPLAQWKCSHCEFCTPGLAVRRVFAVIQSDVEQLDYLEPGGEAVEQREALSRKYRSVLHPQHAFLTLLRCSLSQLYGRTEGYGMEDLPDILLERKVDICKAVLAAADVVEPGLSRLRGMTLYELHAPLVLLARSMWRSEAIDDRKLRARLQEAEAHLQEAVHILKHEHPATPEGSIARAAEQSLQQLRESIASLPT